MNKNILSLTALQIPFLEYNDAIRVQMGCSSLRQAVPLMYPDIPLIKTGYESTFVEYSSRLIKAKTSGKCIFSQDGFTIVKYDDGSERGEVIDSRVKSVGHFDGCMYCFLKEGDAFQPGEILASTRNIDATTGELKLGKNLLTGIISSWHNFEDGILVSESAADKLKYVKVEAGEIVLENDYLESLNDHVYKPVPNIGEYVQKGQVIFYKDSFDKADALTLIPTPRAIYAPCDGHFFWDIYIKKYKSQHTAMQNWLMRLHKEHVMKDNRMQELFADMTNFTSNVRRYCYTQNADNIEADTALIKFYIVDEVPIFQGCKLANRHGNKGTVSKVVPDEMMPMVVRGGKGHREFLEVAINPLGVISRMNLGQVMECHLNRLSQLFIEKSNKQDRKTFAENIIEFISMTDGTPDKLYTKACKHHLNNNPDVLDDIKVNGLQLMQPPFHGMKPKQLLAINEHFKIGMNEKFVESVDASKLFMNDYCFDNKSGIYDCTVGMMNFMRLVHEPDFKVFGRSVGVYGKHQQAPSGADAHRFGEMEEWCLEAYEAKEVIRQLLSHHADNPIARETLLKHRMYGLEDIENLPNKTVTGETFKTYLESISLGIKFD